MALTAMSIYKNLPKTNCKDCGFPTCMAFAMQVAAKQKELTACPHLSEQAKGEFSEASAPPMKLVRVGGAGAEGFEIGQETVMFRHEEKFHHAPAIAVKIAAALSDGDAAARLDAINKAQWVRVGQQLGVRAAALELDGLPADKAAARAKALAASSRVPFILMAKDAGVMGAAVGAIAGKRPLIYQASATNADAFIKLALGHKCPLAITADSLESLADLAKTAKDRGVSDLVLSLDAKNPAKTLRQLAIARRAALKKSFRALGFPAMVDASLDNPARETVMASAFAAKYAGIVIVNGLEASELLPILTTIQNVYTDPQVPNIVETKLYEIGSTTPDSPVLFTTNFSLTYFCVAGEVERSKIPAFICVVDSGGLGVLNAYAGDKISPEKVVKTLEAQKVPDRVKHRRLIIPGLLPSFRSEIEETSVWKQVLIGPENASGIPAFLKQHGKQ
ncbi:MAG: acetyl-CoA decarbonylase/synthase complex subunit gamma [Verrucomicrobia bacterium]|nr:acetyl-CoA decarbonylase/synthase complex subunit gamma [Verrucomicrobiota bacterium]